MYQRQDSDTIEKLKISNDAFDERGNLVPVERGEWDRAFIEITTEEVINFFDTYSDEDLPF